MIAIETKNHKIHLVRIKEEFTITPFVKHASGKYFSIGELVLDRSELAELIVKLNEVLHGS